MLAMLLNNAHLLARRGDSNPLPGCGCFVMVAIMGVIIVLVKKAMRDRQTATSQTPLPPAAPRSTGEGPIGSHTFACPFTKCPSCGASSDKMRQQWDGLRKVTWTCGYCSTPQVQELRDEELPPVARQRLGLDPAPQQTVYVDRPGGDGMGGVGGLLTGMMIGSMMGGDHHRHQGDDSWTEGGGDDGGWGDSSGDGGDSGWEDSGGDWGDSGGGGDDSGDWN
nr:hypothetical protein [uncultured Holophaga sp.]